MKIVIVIILFLINLFSTIERRLFVETAKNNIENTSEEKEEKDEYKK